MLLLIVAIVVALVIFALLRAFAAPIILISLAVYGYSQLKGDWPLSSATNQSLASQAATTPLPFPLPKQELAVCEALEAANAQFYKLEAHWETADRSSEENAVKKQMIIDQTKSQIDELFRTRNRAVLSVVGTQTPSIEGWLAKLTKISMTEKNFGDGTKRYVTIEGEFPCQIKTTFSTKDILPTPEVLKFMAQRNVGDFVLISAVLVKHDEAMQTPEDALEWGGPLWGPFGGLWPKAIRNPAYVLNVTKIVSQPFQG